MNKWRKWGRRDGLRDVWEVSVLHCVPEKQHIFLIEILFFYSYTVIHSNEKPQKYENFFLDKHFSSFLSAKWS